MFSYEVRPRFGADIKISFREKNEISVEYTYIRYAKFNGKYENKYAKAKRQRRECQKTGSKAILSEKSGKAAL